MRCGDHKKRAILSSNAAQIDEKVKGARFVHFAGSYDVTFCGMKQIARAQKQILSAEVVELAAARTRRAVFVSVY